MRIFLFLFLSCSHLTFSEKNHRIIGGKVAYAAQYPFMAAIYKATADGQYFCGGTLLNQRWILTAGQCVDNAVLFTILLGTNHLKDLGTTGIRFATDEYVLHSDYDPTTLDNDIGLIKLRLDITYSDYIKPVILTVDSIPPALTGHTAVGWGQTSDESPEISDELHFVGVKILDNNECKITYGNQITDNMVCLAGNYNEGTCHGDTGTPVIYTYKSAQIQHGIASFVSANGCESTDPSGYTRISSYRSWIDNITVIG